MKVIHFRLVNRERALTSVDLNDIYGLPVDRENTRPEGYLDQDICHRLTR